MTREEAAHWVAVRERLTAMSDPDVDALLAERDFLWMDVEEGKEIRGEWAAQARRLARKEGRCGCDVCAITHALNQMEKLHVG